MTGVDSDASTSGRVGPMGTHTIVVLTDMPTRCNIMSIHCTDV